MRILKSHTSTAAVPIDDLDAGGLDGWRTHSSGAGVRQVGASL
jgi:hypothetical protein